jgi:short-subunit dehydrogenase
VLVSHSFGGGCDVADRRLCLITGASAGIGAAFARVYAAHGWDVALTARRTDRLTSLADEIRLRYGVETLTITQDLADPAAPEKILAEIEGHGRVVDALVNNAGYGPQTSFAPGSWDQHKTFLQVMLTAPTELAHRVLPGMIDRRFGRIVNVASMAGLLPATPTETLYGPTKSFMIRFSQSLHLEARDQGVHVSVICPGFTYSEFHDVTGSRATVSQAAPPWAWMGSDEVAEAGYEAAEANRALCVPGAPNKTIAALLKLTPDEWVLHLTARHAASLSRV